MARPRIELVITDLDNTLYDWVGWFSRALGELVVGTAHRLGVPTDRVLDELRDEHVQRGTVEDPEAVLDLPAVREAFVDREQAREGLHDALARAARARAATPILYPGVRLTLGRLRRRGVRIVGHSEAPARAVLERVRQLGLQRDISALYARVHARAIDDRDPPPIRVLDPTHKKPDPDAVLEICASEGVPPDRTVYVGDNLARDVWMAHRAGTFAAWAEYGTHHDDEAWGSLERVSHWTPQEVRRFQDRDIDVLRAAAHVTLRESFAEILRAFEWGVALAR